MAKDFSLARKIYSKNTIKRIETKIKLLGVNNKLKPISFLNFRLFTTIILFGIVLYFFDRGYIYAPLISIIYYYLLYYFTFDYRIKKRGKKLEMEALYFFEVLSLTVQTGKNLINAIEITTKNIDSELSDEFKKTILEVNYSKTLTEALNDMKKRIPSDNINNILLNLEQANIFGGNIGDTLNNQIDYLSNTKIQEIRAQINKMPIKISIISVIFFIPLILLLVLGPIILNVMS